MIAAAAAICATITACGGVEAVKSDCSDHADIGSCFSEEGCVYLWRIQGAALPDGCYKECTDAVCGTGLTCREDVSSGSLPGESIEALPTSICAPNL